MDDVSKSALERRWTALGIVAADLAPAPNGTIAGHRSADYEAADYAAAENEAAQVVATDAEAPIPDARAGTAASPGSATLPFTESPPTPAPAADSAGSVGPLPSLDQAVTLGAPLASGGMGIIFLADQPALRREVAVKRLRPEVRGPGAIRAQLREAWVTGMLEHPSIVPIHLLARDADGAPSLVMKRIEGVAWDLLIEEPVEAMALLGASRVDFERDPLEFQLRALVSVCHAISFAHARGVVHLDIKPDNVMIGRYGEVYVLDWGIAAGVPRADGSPPPPWLAPAASIRGVRGTPGWMAPELAAGDGAAIGTTTDVYLLGSLLHAVIARTTRHDGAEVKDILANAFASKPYLYDAKIPPELAALANRATARDPAQRPASADALRQAIEAFLGHRSAAKMADQALGRIDTFEARLRGEERAPAEGTTAEMTLRREFLEIRFALQQSLEAWPENERARAGLMQLLRAMCAFALTHRQLERATECAHELSPRDPELDRRVRALGAELLDDAKRLQHLERDADPDQFHRSRSLLSLGCGLIFLVWNFSLGALIRGGTFTLTMGSLIALWATTVSMFGVTAFFVRKTLLTTAWNKLLVVLFGSGFAAVGVFWSALAVLHPPGMDAVQVVAVTQWVFVYFTLCVAFTMDRRAMWITPLVALLGVTAPMFPAYGFEALGLGGVSVGVYLAWIWRRPRGTPTP